MMRANRLISRSTFTPSLKSYTRLCSFEQNGKQIKPRNRTETFEKLLPHIPKKSLRALTRYVRGEENTTDSYISTLDRKSGPYRCFATTLKSKLDTQKLYNTLNRDYQITTFSAEYDLLHIKYKQQFHPEVSEYEVEEAEDQVQERVSPTKHIFFFKEGCMVCWGMDLSEERSWVEKITPFLINPSSASKTFREQMHYYMGEKTNICRDTIVLSKYGPSKILQKEMLAYSYGMVRSLLLEIIESEIESDQLKKIWTIPENIKRGHLPSSSEWSKIRGEHMDLRCKLNLNSSLLDIPDIFWENHSMGILFDEMQENMEIQTRIDILNKRLDFIENITDTVQSTITDRYSAKLEKIIIVLIAMEVLFYLADKSEMWSSFTYESFFGWNGFEADVPLEHE